MITNYRLNKNNGQLTPVNNYSKLVNFYNKNLKREVIYHANINNDKQPNFILILEIVALSHFDLQEYDNCLALIDRILKLDPNYVTIYDLKGDLFFKLKKFNEAITIFENYLKVCQKKHKILNKIANIYYCKNNIQKSVEYYLHSLKNEETNIEAYTNLGKIFTEQKQIDLAFSYIKKALLLDNSFAPAHNIMGIALKIKNEPELAIRSFLRAINSNKNFTDAYINLGNLLFEKENYMEAIIFFRQAYFKDLNNLNNLKNLALTYSKFIFKEYNTIDAEIILKIIQESNLIHPNQISNSIYSLFILFVKHLENNKNQSDLELIKLISSNQLFTTFFKKRVVTNLQIEIFLTKIRKSILLNKLYIHQNKLVKKFLETLAFQCTLNGFIYSDSEKEINYLKDLANKIEIDVNQNKFNLNEILCLASYRSLQNYSFLKKVSHFKCIKQITNVDFKNKTLFSKKHNQIESLDVIDNDLSVQIKKQYEENPYPVWDETFLHETPYEIKEYFIKRNLNIDHFKEFKEKNYEILIAGCGTGQQAIQSSTRFKNSNVLAIDLSFNSLAYAIKKTKEFDISNIKYMLADILNLHKLKQKFTIIECCGVLHHMEDPYKGWSKLVEKLKPNGLMLISLYSKIGRGDVKKARKLIKENGYKPCKKDMKSFRQSIIEKDNYNLKKLTTFYCFYSLNEFRDLIFHHKEHNFDLLQINKMIKQLGLTFMGFEFNDMTIKKSFIKQYPKSKDYYSLEAWHEYEKINPNTFRNMYNFWVQL